MYSKTFIGPLLMFLVLIPLNAAGSLYPQRVWGTEYEITATHINGLLRTIPGNSNTSDILLYTVDDLCVARSFRPEWDCTVIFMLDATNHQIVIAHQEGYNEEPNHILGAGQRGTALGELADPTGIAVPHSCIKPPT